MMLFAISFATLLRQRYDYADIATPPFATLAIRFSFSTPPIRFLSPPPRFSPHAFLPLPPSRRYHAYAIVRH